MAVEAAKQLSREGRQVSSINVREITLHAALPIPGQEEYVETAFHMLPTEQLMSKDSQWYRFTLYMYNDSTWVTNGTGSVQVTYRAEAPDPVDGNRMERGSC